MRTHLAPSFSLLTLMLAIGLTSACGERARGGEADAAVSVTEIDIGRGLKADMTIEDPTTTFRPTDVVYVSVATKGQGDGTLQARWILGENQEIKTDTRELSPAGPARTEFRMSNPNGLPEGEYKVEITLNGVSAGHKTFTVD